MTQETTLEVMVLVKAATWGLEILEYALHHICGRVHMEVQLHPLFKSWLNELADDLEVLVEVMALINALEKHGRDLGDPESHPVSTASYDLHALRRFPPTETTPYAEGPPVLRILFGYVQDNSGNELAVVTLGGDKTELGNRWYQANVTQAQDRLDQWCQHNPTYKPIVKRGGLR